MVKEILISSRQMKRRRSILRFFVAVFLLAAVCGGVVAIFYYEKWRVAEIKITGNNIIQREEIAGFVHSFIDQKVGKVFPGDNILLAQTDKLTASLAQTFPRFREVVVSREWPSGLNIKVAERETWGSYCLGGKCYLIDKDGFIFAPAPAFEGNLIIKVIDERGAAVARLGDKLILAKPVKEIYDKLSAATGERMPLVTIKTDSEWQVQSLSGWRILIDSATNLDLAAKNLGVVLQEVGDRRAHLDYIDLRYGRKIYYKFK